MMRVRKRGLTILSVYVSLVLAGPTHAATTLGETAETCW